MEVASGQSILKSIGGNNGALTTSWILSRLPNPPGVLRLNLRTGPVRQSANAVRKKGRVGVIASNWIYNRAQEYLRYAFIKISTPFTRPSRFHVRGTVCFKVGHVQLISPQFPAKISMVSRNVRPKFIVSFSFFVFLFPLKKGELGLGVTFKHTYTSHATITGMRGPRSSPDLKQFSGFPKSVVKWERVKKCRILSHQVHNSTQASGTENAPKSTNTVITEGQCNWRSHKKKRGH